jgi:hypothetical protein
MISYGHDRVKRNEFGGGRPCRVKEGHKEKVDGTAKNVLWIVKITRNENTRKIILVGSHDH